MKNYSKEEKSEIKKQIHEAMKDETFTLAGFAHEYGCNVKTIRGIIQSDSKLVKEYEGHERRQDIARRANAQSRASGKGTGAAGASGGTKGNGRAKDAPFVREVAKDEDKAKGTTVITTRSLDIKTMEDALCVAEVDLDVWEVERSKVNSWEVTMGIKETVGKGADRCSETHAETFTNFQVTLWLRRRAPEVLAFEDLVKRMEVSSPVVPYMDRPLLKKTGVVKRELEVSLLDIHLGMRTYAGDSDIDWTPDDCEKMTMDILERLLTASKVHGPFERILFPFGSDYLHSDNIYNTTTKNTPQPEADSWRQNMLRGEVLAIRMVERLKEEAPVKVISIQGNHDFHTSIALGRMLKAYYHHDENVDVCAEQSPYHYHSFGVNLIGFNHGSAIKSGLRLAGLMANETRRTGWVDALYCTYHLGHGHRKGTPNPSFMAEQGVSIEYLPSITVANSWHRNKALNHQVRGGVAFVWDKSAGPIATLATHINSYTGEIME